ncbi:arylsulfatase [Wenyingzhuangia heitensis]|uniref:Arylsulfatase n=1 Tax=Wenyingzhuangia heitensis TaxID=1487859 RepID=A0ABX0UEN7_9FLAO|nr:arylsulfatase [Wenyingzhuangia heitensis]NIJ45911.1 arylsulfatase [Wenyingzhuangia heitensis]
MKKRNLPFLILLLFSLNTVISFGQKKEQKPNIVLIMGDDIGFSDIGAYGGEIETPNIDRLAHGGLRFKTFYNMAKCAATRSSMLTGLYTGGNGAVHIANLAKKAGYTTLMSGKEHFNNWVPKYCRAENAFDKSLHFWATTEYFVPPSGQYSKPFYLGTKKLNPSEIEHEISPLYKTDFITDYALNWLDESFKKEDKPFFLYLPYHAAHYPLQARPEDIKKYRGKYKKGWDKLRAERYKKMQKLGVVSKDLKLSPPENNLNTKRGPLVKEYTDYYPWENLSEEKKDSLDLEMAVYAAIVDRMDQNIGRVLDKLEKEGKLENTLVLFLNDNGSCPFYTNRVKDVEPGPANSYWSLRTTWANLGNTPFRQFKQAGHEGGSHTPFIAHWPNKIKPNTITDQVAHIVDIAPTFLDVLGIEYPKSINGHTTIPLHGSSLLPIFKGKERKEPDYFISGIRNYRMFRSGDFKIVQMNGSKWELYNIKKDPTELVNLAKTNPNKVKELANSYASSPMGFHKNKK